MTMPPVFSNLIPSHTVKVVTRNILQAVVSHCQLCRAPMGPVRVHEGSQPSNRHHRGRIVQTVSSCRFCSTSYRLKPNNSVVVNAKAVTGLHISQIQLISTKTHKGFLIRSSCFDSGGREPLFHFSQATMFSALLILSWLLMYHPLMGLSSVAALNATSLPIILDDTVPLVSAHDKCASLAVLELPNVPYLKDFNPIVAVLILNSTLR